MTGKTPRDVHEAPMWADPNEAAGIRQLLRAGRVERVDYDVEAGLAQHLANLQASAPLPAWALQSSLQKSAFFSLWGWLVPPVVSVVALGGWLYAHQPELPRPGTAPVQAANLAAAPAPLALEPAVAVAAAAAQAAAPSPNQDIEAAQAWAVPEGRSDSRRASTLHGRSGSSYRAHLASRADMRRQARVSALSGSGATASGTGVAPVELASASYETVTVPSRGAVSAPSAASAATSTATSAAGERPAAVESEAARDAAKPAPAPTRPQAEVTQPERAGMNDARLEREMQMLAVAQRVLYSDPGRALRLTRQGEREFPRSMFSAERKQVSLLALVKLGKVEEARRLGVPFLRAFPNAPWSARLREALVNGRLPAP